MIKVSALIEELQKLPPDAYVYAYEGELCGIIVVEGSKDYKSLATIIASSWPIID